MTTSRREWRPAAARRPPTELAEPERAREARRDQVAATRPEHAIRPAARIRALIIWVDPIGPGIDPASALVVQHAYAREHEDSGLRC